VDDEIGPWKLRAPTRKDTFGYKDWNPYGFHAAGNIPYIFQNTLERDGVIESHQHGSVVYLGFNVNALGSAFAEFVVMGTPSMFGHWHIPCLEAWFSAGSAHAAPGYFMDLQ
jgi:hypothetical protein